MAKTSSTCIRTTSKLVVSPTFQHGFFTPPPFFLGLKLVPSLPFCSPPPLPAINNRLSSNHTATKVECWVYRHLNSLVFSKRCRATTTSYLHHNRGAGGGSDGRIFSIVPSIVAPPLCPSLNFLPSSRPLPLTTNSPLSTPSPQSHQPTTPPFTACAASQMENCRSHNGVAATELSTDEMGKSNRGNKNGV